MTSDVVAQLVLGGASGFREVEEAADVTAAALAEADPPLVSDRRGAE
jgi:hypothetical protein